jgi:hypothetical protein
MLPVPVLPTLPRMERDILVVHVLENRPFSVDVRVAMPQVIQVYSA